ncbi:MAG: hypothetical protein V1727_06660 [Candidatus Omnitrophota bacterium]
MKKLKKVIRQTARRWSWAVYRKRNIKLARIGNFLIDGVKLHIGCGDKKLPGYVNIDIVPTEGTDVVLDIAKDLYLIPDGIAAQIRLESVFEHFYRYDQEAILREFHRILKKEGELLIYWLPDFDAIVDTYRQKKFDLYNVYRYSHGDPIKRNSPQQLHKDLFTKDTISALLVKSGFAIEKMKNEVFPGEDFAVSVNIKAVKK